LAFFSVTSRSLSAGIIKLLVLSVSPVKGPQS
jgi:hypothetical protein